MRVIPELFVFVVENAGGFPAGRDRCAERSGGGEPYRQRTQAPWHLAHPEPLPARRYVDVDMTFREIVGVHPLPGSLIRQLLLRCAEECLDCAASCIACADVSLSVDDQTLIRVIRVALDCADACELTGRVAIRQSAPDIRLIRGVIEGCAAACLACAEECDGYAADHEQCRLCAEVCRRCKTACDEFLAH